MQKAETDSKGKIEFKKRRLDEITQVQGEDQQLQSKKQSKFDAKRILRQADLTKKKNESRQRMQVISVSKAKMLTLKSHREPFKEVENIPPQSYSSSLLNDSAVPSKKT